MSYYQELLDDKLTLLDWWEIGGTELNLTHFVYT